MKRTIVVQCTTRKIISSVIYKSNYIDIIKAFEQPAPKKKATTIIK